LDKCHERSASRISTGTTAVTIYVNDVDEGIVSKIYKFNGDTKFFPKVYDEEEAKALKENS